ncbi:MAG: DNA mismatch repair endonuclease MutL [Bdellovibrionales bacterium]|nr:DNA mismatch repair endonuclease MutL [Bdellovibrionales bacterium]
MLNPAPILALDQATILKIAAGEVIERPACIVKELIENAIDARATHIEVNIQNGGLDEITVKDNGHGISSAQLELAIRPHATSKLGHVEDLDTLVTLGFRGEALASIASISELNLRSRTANDKVGQQIVSKYGDIVAQKPCALPFGTTVTVTSLFLNVPARKKFLKAPSTEKQHIERVLQRASLTHPEIAWDFTADSSSVFSLKPVKSLKTRIHDVYGREIASHLLAIEHTQNEMSVTGYISDQSLHYARSQALWIFVNGRPVQDKTIHSAIMEGYRTALMEKRYPFALISLNMPAFEVDVNIHPRKSEVRFRRSQDIYRLVAGAIQRSLEPSASIPSTTYQVSLGNTSSPMTQSSVSNIFMDTSNQVFHDHKAPYEANLEKDLSYPMKYLGHIDHTYLIFSDSKNLFIVDQHAAHERILFEQFKNRPSDTRLAQHCLIPKVLELTPKEDAILKQIYSTLLAIGFEIETFGHHTYLIRMVPSCIGNKYPKLILMDLLHDKMVSQPNTSWDDLQDDLLSRMACHSAIRAHDTLTQSEIDRLLTDMQKTRLSSYCPHGRPTYVQYSIFDLEKLFYRK